MADKSSIEWTDATVNFWWGCTQVGPGCDHCYALAWDKRTGGAHFGQGVARRQIISAPNTLAKLNKQGGKWVFIQSMSDLFDNEVPAAWFSEAWFWIERATACRIQIVTKRISMVEKRLREIGATSWPAHVGLLVTVTDQAEADRDVPRLLALKAKLGIPWVGLSIEPLLGPIDLNAIEPPGHVPHSAFTLQRVDDLIWSPGINWIIVGGESGPHARAMHPDWALSLLYQCEAAGVPFFFKQWGEFAPQQRGADWINTHPASETGCQIIRWPSDADNTFDVMVRTGKSRAGRLLDGREHNAMPGV